MVEELLQTPIELFRNGDIDGALADLDDNCKTTEMWQNCITCGLNLPT